MAAAFVVCLFRAAHQLEVRFGFFHQAAIRREIVERHAARGEALFELFSDSVAVQTGEPANGSGEYDEAPTRSRA